MNKATPAQQEAYDACQSAALSLRVGLDVTPEQIERIKRALLALKAEPQPAGLTEALEMGLRAFIPEGDWDYHP